MKIVRISREELREWRSVKSKLISESGVILRDVTEDELKILAELARRVKHTRRGIEWVNEDKSKIIRVVPDDTKPGTFVTKQTIDGMPVDTGRARMRAEFFARYGECQLRLSNGKFLASIRDPQKLKVSRSGTAPRPEQCKCKTWGTPHPKRHHQNCHWNEFAPVANRATTKSTTVASGKFKNVIPEKEIAPEITGTFTPIGAAVPSPAPKAKTKPQNGKVPITPPTECSCREWKKTSGSVEGEHHPLCTRKDTWDKHVLSQIPNPSTPVSSKVLIDLDTREVQRDATADEIKEAEDGGVAIVGDKTFGVVDPSEVSGAPA